MCVCLCVCVCVCLCVCEVEEEMWVTWWMGYMMKKRWFHSLKAFFRKGGVTGCGTLLFLWLLSLLWSLIFPIDQQIFRLLFPSVRRSGDRWLFCWITYRRFRFYQAVTCCCVFKVPGVTFYITVVSEARIASGCLELLTWKNDARNIQCKYWRFCENMCRTVSGCLLTDRYHRYWQIIVAYFILCFKSLGNCVKYVALLCLLFTIKNSNKFVEPVCITWTTIVKKTSI